LGKTLIDWYEDAASVPFSHLMIDIHPRTSDKLRYCTNSTDSPTQFYLPPSKGRITTIDEQHTSNTWSTAVWHFYTVFKANVPRKVSKRIYNVSLIIKGNLNLSGVELRKFEPHIRKLIKKTTSISTRRLLLSTKLGISLIDIITPLIINHFGVE